MNKTRKPQADDIIPPPRNATDDAGAQAPKGLRMPPIIDLPAGTAGRFIALARRWLGGTAYQLSLLALLLVGLGFLGLAFWEAGNLRRADWPSWMAYFDRDTPRPQTAPVLTQAPPANMPLAAKEASEEGPEDGLKDATEATEASVAPEAPEAPKAMDENISVAGQATPGVTGADTARASPRLSEDMRALRQTLADTRRELAAAQTALQAATQNGDSADDAASQAQARAALTRLTQRAALADLLLRLDYGWPFDDVLDSGHLEAILRPAELAVLALHAVTGLPTEASLNAQAETLPHILADMESQAASVPGPLAWLAAQAPKLMTIKQTPMAGAEAEMQILYDRLMAGDYQAAAQAIQMLIFKFQSDGRDDEKVTAALQALYADLRAYGETRPVLAVLRSDYMSGVRP